MTAWMNIGLGVVASALALAAPAAAQQHAPQQSARPAADTHASACTLTITPSVLRAGARPLLLTAVPSQGIGAVGSADLQPAGSGIAVWIAQTASANPSAGTRRGVAAPGPSADAQAAPPAPLEPFHLTFNTAAARPGAWTLAVSGEEGTCTGAVRVDAAAPTK